MSYDLGTAHGKIVLDYDGHGATDRAAEDIDKLSKNSKEGDKSVKKLSISLSTLGAIGKKVALGGLFAEASVGAANLGIQLLGIIPQLASIGSLAATIPGTITGIVASVIVLKSVFNGVGDAIKFAFDPKKAEQFQEALKNLSPSAAAFVSAIHKLAPELQNYSKGIQEAFFRTANLTSLLPRAQATLAALSTPLRGLSSDFGAVTRDVAQFALSAQSTKFVSDSINAFRQALLLVTPSIVPILEGLREVGQVGLPLMNQLAAETGFVATKFADWLHQIASSGQLQDWINTALSTLSTLGQVLKNVGSIFISVVSAAQDVGGGLLNTLADLTGQVANFFKSAEGAAALRDVFAAIASVAKPLGPILTTAAGAIAKALGPAIVQLTSALGPALLQVVQALAPALGPLAQALASILVAITPLLAPAAELISLLAKMAAIIVQDLANELGPVIATLSQGLLGAFQALQPAVDAFAQILPLAADAGVQVGKAFAPLIPILVQVAQTFAQAFVDNMPALLDALKQFIPVAVQFANVLAGQVGQALQRLIPYIPTLVKLFIDLLVVSGKIESVYLRVWGAVLKVGGAFQSLPGAVGGALKAFGGAVASAFSSIGSLIQPVINVFKNLPATIGGALSGVGSFFSSAFSSIGSILSTVGNAVVGFFTALPGRILAALQALPGLLLAAIQGALNGIVTTAAYSIGLVVGIFTKLPGDIVNAVQTLLPIVGGALRNAWNAAYAATVNGIASVLSFAASLPGKIGAAISSAISTVGGALRSAWNAAYSATVNGVNSAINYARNLPGRMAGAVRSLIGLLGSVGSSALNSFRNAVVNGANSAVNFLRGLPGRLRGALGNLGGLLYSSGRAIIDGLYNGITSAGDRVIGYLRGLASRAKDAFNAALSIFSPSREFKWSGEMIGLGLIKGIQSKFADVTRAAQALANTVIQPTLDLPASATMAVAGITTLPAARAAAATSDGGTPDFGPYELKVDQGTLARFTIDAVTGAPKVVAATAAEGQRLSTFAGSGRGR